MLQGSQPSCGARRALRASLPRLPSRAAEAKRRGPARLPYLCKSPSTYWLFLKQARLGPSHLSSAPWPTPPALPPRSMWALAHSSKALLACHLCHRHRGLGAPEQLLLFWFLLRSTALPPFHRQHWICHASASALSHRWNPDSRNNSWATVWGLVNLCKLYLFRYVFERWRERKKLSQPLICSQKVHSDDSGPGQARIKDPIQVFRMD